MEAVVGESNSWHREILPLKEEFVPSETRV